MTEIQDKKNGTLLDEDFKLSISLIIPIDDGPLSVAIL